MSDASEDFKFTLKVMIDKKKKKVLFAESDCQFVDILLSFLTLPLGRMIKILHEHYGEEAEAPAIGSLHNLYRFLANVGNADFVTEDAKKILLNPRSPFEAEYGMLKLSITEFQPATYVRCRCCEAHLVVSIYYDHAICLRHGIAHLTMNGETKQVPKAASEGVFASGRASFIISDDLKIFPSVLGIFQISSILGITNMDEAESIVVKIGFNEIVRLLKLSFNSPTPLSDLVLNKTSLALALEPKTLVNHSGFQEKLGSKKIVLKVMVQKSKHKLLYVVAEDDFVEFLLSLFVIPLGGVEYLLSGETCIKAIDNLQRSVADLADKYFKSPSMKKRLMKPSLVHGCVSENYILPLDQDSMISDGLKKLKFSSLTFPKGQGRYLAGPIGYMVMDDLTVNPFCIHSTISFLREKNIPMSDVEEVEVQVGLKEALSILKASLTSTSVLTDALLNSVPVEQPKKKVKLES